IAQQPAHGHVVINAQQQIVYTPDPNFVGEDIFSYMICDEVNPSVCDEATVTISVEPVNDTLSYVVPADAPFTICADELTQFASGSANAISACTGSSHGGSISIEGACLTYTPALGYVGPDSVCVVVCDPENPTLCDETVLAFNYI